MRDLSGSRVALFVPCYVDQFAPQVGFATLQVLRRVGVVAKFPRDQTCCGQPMANAGFVAEARPVASHFASVFEGFDYIVCPSGSCTAMVRHTYRDLLGETAAAVVGARTYELCEFLFDIVGVTRMAGRFPHRVGLHRSCHGLRALRLGACSERVEPPRDVIASLLVGIDGLQLVEPTRADECCGFGGTFSIDEAGVSAMMGRDRLRDHGDTGAEIIASIDMSCLLHLDSLRRRDGGNIRVMHVAEILAACEPAR